ncbi:MAG: hypothetical protein EBV05_02760 [Cyanobacteria bacterium WB6_1B_304]|nr:hypothetical protein [Cyanobacteria bacterium WB6_1B_304]
MKTDRSSSVLIVLVVTIAFFLPISGCSDLSDFSPAHIHNTRTPNSARLVSQISGVDYSELDHALRTRQWKKADELTATLMLKVAGKLGYLDEKDIRQFPGEDLQLIDNLWLGHSHNKLGFSVQKQIWIKSGKPAGADYYGSDNRPGWIAFENQVGWQGINYSEIWRAYGKLNWANPQKFRGHLPGGIWMKGIIRQWEWADLFYRPEI